MKELDYELDAPCIGCGGLEEHTDSCWAELRDLRAEVERLTRERDQLRMELSIKPHAERYADQWYKDHIRKATFEATREAAAKEAFAFDLPSVVVEPFEAASMTASGIRNKIRCLTLADIGEGE